MFISTESLQYYLEQDTLIIKVDIHSIEPLFSATTSGGDLINSSDSFGIAADNNHNTRGGPPLKMKVCFDYRLMEDMKRLWKEKYCHDVVFNVLDGQKQQQQQILAHSYIISQNEVLANVLEEKVDEGRYVLKKKKKDEDKGKDKDEGDVDDDDEALFQIDVPDVPARAFSLLIEYLYCWDIRLIKDETPQVLVDWVCLAYEHGVQFSVKSILSAENVLPLFVKAKEQNIAPLLEECHTYFEENPEIIESKRMESFALAHPQLTLELTRIIVRHAGDKAEPQNSKKRLKTVEPPEMILKSHLKKINDQSKFADLVLVCDDGSQIKAHRGLLCARNDYFAMMFSGHFAERHTKEIKFHEFGGPLLKYLFDLIYGKRQDITTSNALELIPLFDFFQMEREKLACAAAAKEMLCPENVWDVFDACYKYNLQSNTLKQFCLQMIADDAALIARAKEDLSSKNNEMLADIIAHLHSKFM